LAIIGANLEGRLCAHTHTDRALFHERPGNPARRPARGARTAAWFIRVTWRGVTPRCFTSRTFPDTRGAMHQFCIVSAGALLWNRAAARNRPRACFSLESTSYTAVPAWD